MFAFHRNFPKACQLSLHCHFRTSWSLTQKWHRNESSSSFIFNFLSCQKMKKAELIFIPSPGMGHLMAAVEMAKLLISQHHHLFITVITMKLPFDSKAASYAEYLSSAGSDRISFIVLPHRNNDYADPNPLAFNTSFMEDQKPCVKRAVAELFRSKSTRPDSPRLAGFLVDMFCTAMIDVADEFGLPAYVFYTSGAGFLGFMFHFLSLHDRVR